MRIFLHVLKTSNEIRLIFPFDVKLESCTYFNYELLEPPFVHSLIHISIISDIYFRKTFGIPFLYLQSISLPFKTHLVY